VDTEHKKNEPITSSMSLRVGSTAKLFANYLILKSVQDSIISLDDKLSNGILVFQIQKL
jgi:CubicO group peptidase (beta-lactamase class C family)